MKSSRSIYLRKILFNVLAITVGLILALVFLELILRVFNLAPTSGVGTVSQKNFDRIPGLFIPDQDLIDLRKPKLPHNVHINSLGYRGSDFPIEKPVGEYRIVMIGDSFTYGDFVDDNQTLPSQLAKYMGDRCKNVRVINAGVGGSTILTHGKMAQRALVLEPDLVILTFSENDVDDLATPLWNSLAENRRMKSEFPLSIVYPFLRNTAIWNFALQTKAKLALVFKNNKPKNKKTGNLKEPNLKLRNMYSRMLDDLHKHLTRENIPFMFSIYPSHYNISDHEKRGLIKWITQTSIDLGIHTVNLLVPLVDSGISTGDTYLLPFDGHPSYSGYSISAKYLGAELTRLPYLQPFCEH